MFRLLSLTILRHRVLGNIYLTFSQDENQEHYLEDIYAAIIFCGTYMLYLYHVVLVMTDSGCVSFHLCGSSCNSSSYDAFV